MASIVIDDSENLEKAIKRFKRQVEKKLFIYIDLGHSLSFFNMTELRQTLKHTVHNAFHTIHI